MDRTAQKERERTGKQLGKKDTHEQCRTQGRVREYHSTSRVNPALFAVFIFLLFLLLLRVPLLLLFVGILFLLLLFFEAVYLFSSVFGVILDGVLVAHLVLLLFGVVVVVLVVVIAVDGDSVFGSHVVVSVGAGVVMGRRAGGSDLALVALALGFGRRFALLRGKFGYLAGLGGR